MVWFVWGYAHVSKNYIQFQNTRVDGQKHAWGIWVVWNHKHNRRAVLMYNNFTSIYAIYIYCFMLLALYLWNCRVSRTQGAEASARYGVFRCNEVGVLFTWPLGVIDVAVQPTFTASDHIGEQTQPIWWQRHSTSKGSIQTITMIQVIQMIQKIHIIEGIKNFLLSCSVLGSNSITHVLLLIRRGPRETHFTLI